MGEVIAPPSPKDYLVPAHLHGTAPDLVAELERLLAELRELNARFVGRNTNDCQSYLSLTGEHEALEDKFYRWCRSYFTRRGNLHGRDPRLKNDPFELYRQCVKESDGFIGRLNSLEGALNMTVLGLSVEYIRSEFADQVMRLDVSRFQHSEDHRFTSLGNAQKAEACVVRYHRSRQIFAGFLNAVGSHLPAEYAPSDSPDWESTIRTRIKLRAEELELLRFAQCSLNADLSTPRQLAPDLWSRCDWDVYQGASVIVLQTGTDPEALTGDATSHSVGIRRDGWLCLREFSWIWLNPDALPAFLGGDRRRLIGADLFVLDMLTDPLYLAWDALDVELVVRRGVSSGASEAEKTAALAVAMATAPNDEPDQAPEPGLEVFGAPEPAVAAVQEKTRGVRGRKVGVLRLRKFARVLRTHFDCVWSQGDGSHVKVVRQGSHYYTFANHGHGQVVLPHTVVDCLDRLSIPLADFLVVCR
jgi:hypothetical protein